MVGTARKKVSRVFLSSAKDVSGTTKASANRMIIFILLNPDLLHLAHADVIVAPIIEASRFGVRMPRHALRDLDAGRHS